jgi:hypothetical protein
MILLGLQHAVTFPVSSQVSKHSIMCNFCFWSLAMLCIEFDPAF